MRSLLAIAALSIAPSLAAAQEQTDPEAPKERPEQSSAAAPKDDEQVASPAAPKREQKVSEGAQGQSQPIFDFFPLSGGRASFPLADGLDPIVLEAHLTVYTQYVLSLRNDAGETDWFHEFELPRAQARLDASFEGARARVMVEGVRSASEGSLLGVAGDSFVLRLREAWLAYTAWDHLETRVGLVPTLTLGPIESLWGMRMVAPTGLERAGLLSPADLGATVRGFFPKGFGWVGAGAYNGEGYTQRELNRGKNIEVATEVHPFAFSAAAAPFTVLASYSSGSSGTALARSNRVSASLGWQGDVIRGGASFGYAWGVDDQGDTLSTLAEGFVRVRPIPRLSLGADAVFWSRDLDAESDWAVTVTGSAGYFIVDPLGVFLAVDGVVLGDEARQSLPPKDDVRFRFIGAVEF